MFVPINGSIPLLTNEYFHAIQSKHSDSVIISKISIGASFWFDRGFWKLRHDGEQFNIESSTALSLDYGHKVTVLTPSGKEFLLHAERDIDANNNYKGYYIRVYDTADWTLVNTFHFTTWVGQYSTVSFDITGICYCEVNDIIILSLCRIDGTTYDSTFLYAVHRYNEGTNALTQLSNNALTSAYGTMLNTGFGAMLPTGQGNYILPITAGTASISLTTVADRVRNVGIEVLFNPDTNMFVKETQSRILALLEHTDGTKKIGVSPVKLTGYYEPNYTNAMASVDFGEGSVGPIPSGRGHYTSNIKGKLYQISEIVRYAPGATFPDGAFRFRGMEYTGGALTPQVDIDTIAGTSITGPLANRIGRNPHPSNTAVVSGELYHPSTTLPDGRVGLFSVTRMNAVPFKHVPRMLGFLSGG